MNAIKSTIVELLVLGVLGLALGTTANGVRATGSLSWSKTYFAKTGTAQVAPSGASELSILTDSGGAPAPDQPTQAQKSGAHFEHRFQKANFDDVVEVINDPDFQTGLYVIVDARNRSEYEDGHIEGAIRCFHYEVETCIDSLLQHAIGAAKVIVYCNGGDCEDSLYMCQELEEQGVPYESIYLYGGGIKEWKAKGMLIVKGGD